MKRLISMVLSVIMVISLLPSSMLAVSAKETIEIGDYVQMGTYYGEPILWRCVGVDENGPLILSDKIICAKAFDSSGNTGLHTEDDYNYGSNSWDYSNIKVWLNSNQKSVNYICGNPPSANNIYDNYNSYDDEPGFLTNFTRGEISAVKEVNQITYYPSSYHYNYGFASYMEDILLGQDVTYELNIFDDKMFLLDYKQLATIYANREILGNNYHHAKSTQQAISHSDSKNIEGYWLRSPEDKEAGATLIKGDIYHTIPNKGVVGIRPAFYMNNDTTIFVSGNGTKGNPYVILKSGIDIEGENSVQNNKETVLKAIRYDENGNVAPEGGITWSCSDESVAQITPWGNSVTVKGLKGGKVTITATHAASGQKADFEIEVVSYVMSLFSEYDVMLDDEFEISYAVKQGEEYVHNDIDIKWEIESKDSNNAVKIISDKDNAYTRALTVKGINEGECELVAKVDGTEIGRTKIEVLGNLADTINDETIIRAKYLVNNSQYKYYKNYDSVHRMFAESMDLTKSTVNYSLNKFMEIARESVEEWSLPDKTSAVNFYEYTLLKLLCAEENVNVFGKTGEIMEDYIIKYGSKIADAGTKITDEDKKWLKEMCESLCGDGIKDVGFLDSILVSGKAISTFFEEFASVYRMSNCTELQINAVKQIRANATDNSLRTACDNVINYLKQAQTDTAKAAIASGMVKTGEQLLDYSMDTAISLAKKSNPILIAIDISLGTSNFLFKTKDLSVDTLNNFALMHVEDALKTALKKSEKSFDNNSTADNAQELIALADLYKNAQLYGCDVCDSYLENYGKAIRNQGIALDTIAIILKNVVKREVKISDIFNALFGNFDNDTIEKRATLASIRKLIESADFYGSEGTDVAEFIREVKSTTSSDWAKAEIEKAKNYGFLPDYMQNNYQNNITRAEFCTILTWMIEAKTDKGIGQLIEEKGTAITTPFTDTYYEYVDYMYKLGIVNGIGNGQFNPLGEISREQAARMLMVTAEVLGYDTSYNVTVGDDTAIWAIDAVGFVMENGIMNGTGNGFDPKGYYTKEQAVATFVRMFENLK